MTIIEKLSDSHGFIYEAILIVLNNVPATPEQPMNEKRLQWELFKCGVYLKKPLLRQAIAVMKENKQIGINGKETSQEEVSKATPSTIIQP